MDRRESLYGNLDACIKSALPLPLIKECQYLALTRFVPVDRTHGNLGFDLDKYARLLRDSTFMKITTRSGLIVLTFLLLAAVGRNAQAISPPPDGCYSGFSTGE